MTKAEAAWIVRLSAAVPELVSEPMALRGWARRYIDAGTAGEGSDDFDAALAVAFYGAERIR